MTKKTIGELDDVTDTQQDDAVCAIEQIVGITPTTFKARVRPNPPTQVNVTSEEQLITKFDDGSGGILIPASSNVTIFVDASFTLTKPIVIGGASSLKITSSVIGTAIAYTSGFAMFQNQSATIIDSLEIENITITGNGITEFIDTLKASDRVIINNVNIDGFIELGDITATDTIRIRDVLVNDFEIGFVLRNAKIVFCDDIQVRQVLNPETPTFISVLGTGALVPMRVFLNSIEIEDTDATDNTLFFIDSNLPTGSFTVIEESSIVDVSQEFYQLGTDLEIGKAVQNVNDVTFTTAIGATGTVTLNAVVNGDTFTVNGLVYTGVIGDKTNNTEFDITVSNAAAAADLADSITNDARTGTDVPSIDQTATSSLAVVTITADVGALGNDIGLATVNPSTLILSGNFLTGGVGIADNGLGVNDKVSLRGFSVPTYNDVFTVTAVTATTFDVTLAFVIDDTGFMDITIKSTSTSGTSPTTFTTNVAHNLKVGQAVILSNFSGGGSAIYNGTSIVTNVGSPTTFDLDIVSVVTSATGTMNGASLDSTDIFVTAQANPGQRDSVSLAESKTSGTIVVDNTADDFVPIIGASPAVGDFIQGEGTERFAVDVTSGIITYIGVAPITVLTSFQLDASPTSGGAQLIKIAIFKNDIQQESTQILINTANTPFGINGRSILSLVQNDTIELRQDNTSNTTSTDVKDLKLVISKQ